MEANRPFRFCVLTGGGTSKKEWVDKTCQAEDLGYDSLLFSDHVFNQMDPVAAMTAGAGVTHSLRFGSYMFGNDFHHPILLAQQAATVDLLSDGRLDLGLGTGYLHYDYTQLGLKLDSPMTRINRLKEAVIIIKRYFTGQPFEFHGTYYHVDVTNIAPAPIQKPHPPILMGGGGREMIKLAAREADIVSFNPRTTREGWFDFSSVSPDATEQKLHWFREEAGDRAGDVELSAIISVVKITDRESEAIECLEQFRKNFSVTDDQLTLTQTRESPHVLVGSLSEVKEKLFANRERFGLSHYVIFEPIETSMELVKHLAGQ